MIGNLGDSGWRKVLIIGVAVLAILLILMAIGLGCGNGKKESTEQKSGDRPLVSSPAGVEAEKEGQAAEAPKDTGITSVQPGAEDDTSLDIKAIKTGTLTLQIEKNSFNDVYGKVVLVATGVGGYVSDSRSQSEGGKITGGTVTIRIPNKSFSTVMEGLKELGKVTEVGEQSEDVTEEYVDLESRLRNLRAQESVYLGLMGKAETIEESIAIQRELSLLQGQIETLSGRKNYLDNHAEFSTIQVTLYEPGTEVGENGGGWGFVDALSDAVHGVVNGMNAVVRFLGDALIYIIIAAAVALLIYFAVRRRRNSKRAA